jgi:hypothetical protein
VEKALRKRRRSTMKLKSRKELGRRTSGLLSA